MREKIVHQLNESAMLSQELAQSGTEMIESASELITSIIDSGGKLLLFGNGGSASDAEHIAAEFVNRFSKERRALAALALTVNGSVLTSIGNDSSFDHVFSRQIEALGNERDLAWAFSTSGDSRNVLAGVQKAKQMGLATLGFTGDSGGELTKLVDCCVKVPSDSTPRVQEMHITIAHIICEIVDDHYSGL